MGIPTRTLPGTPRIPIPGDVARYLLLIKAVSFASIITSPLWFAALFFTSPQDYSPASSFICVPLLAILGVVITFHFTQNDPYLRRLMLAGMAAHLVASSLFLWIGFAVYGGTVDAFHYWTMGLQIADRFQIVGWSAFHGPWWSTNLISNLCGFATLLIGDALPTLFIASSLVSLAGAYLLYRAFTIAFPAGDRWLFGLLVLFMPSLLFWSSFVGKDSLIQYFIALTCFGFARITQRPTPSGVLFCAAGLGGALLLRAHIAAMLAIAITFPYAVGRSRSGAASKAGKLILIPLLALSTYFLVSQAKSFIDLQNENSSGVLQQADIITRNSQIGGSAFNQGASLPVRIAESPFLLFRPFPWEIHNFVGVAAALESACLTYFVWVRRREIRTSLQHWRDPFVSFLLMYSAVFLVTFGGSISNFGILLRQRIMVVPAVLMLLCIRRKSPARVSPQDIKGPRWLPHSSTLLAPGRVSMRP